MSNHIGIERAFDDLGRVVIPKEIRDRLEIKDKSIANIYAIDRKIILEISEDSCIFCGDKQNLKQVLDKFVCKKCLKKIN